MVQALVTLHTASGEDAHLDETLVAAHWILAHRALPKNSFRHDEKDPAGPYLDNSLTTTRAFLALYSATTDRAWLARAEKTADFIAARFKIDDVPGFVTTAPARTADRPKPQQEENVALARFANLLSHYSGKPAHQQMADDA